MKYKYHGSINKSREEQGLIYYTCQNARLLPPRKQIYILNLCIKIGGEYSNALYETLTTSANMLYTANNHYMDESNLYRLVKQYYEAFDVILFENYYEQKKEQGA